MRGTMFGLAALVAATAPAFAGDYAARETLGFFNGGEIFAFEEYGIEDGSGFPYATIYVIDTATDSWLPGTPVSVRLDDEVATLQAARDEAGRQADPILAGLGLAEPGEVLLTNLITDLSSDPHRAEFLTRAYSPLPSDGEVLTLSEVPLSGGDCPDFGDTYVGFDLRLTLEAGGTSTLHRDTRIPASRGCPIGYGISEVIAYHRPSEIVLIVLVDVFSVGFEGPDRRFLAVASTLPPL